MVDRMRRFVEHDDPFVEYVLEDVYIRKRVGSDAVRARVPHDAEDVLELYSMNDQALERIARTLTSGRPVDIRLYKLRKPTPEELERWLVEQQELEGDEGPALPPFMP